MDFFEELLKRNVLVAGLAIGIGVVLLAPDALPAAARVLRPAAKAVIRGGAVLFERVVETGAELVEAAEDAYAEARAELEARAKAAESVGEAASESSSADARGNPA